MKCNHKQATHRDWIGTLNDIWTNHPIARIQKLADKNVGTAPGFILCFGLGIRSSTFGERYQRKDGNHSDPLLSSCGIILCFGTAVKLSPSSDDFDPEKLFSLICSLNGTKLKLKLNEIKSQAVLKFWTDIEKAKLGNKLFSMHFNGFTELVEHRNDLIPKSEYNELQRYSDSLFTFIILLCGEYFAHIIDLDNATEREKPQFFTVEEWSKIISESQPPSIKLPKSVEEQLDCYLGETTIKKVRESFDSYKKVTLEEDIYTRKVMEHLLFCATTMYRVNILCTIYWTIIEPFIFIFKNLDITWGEVSSLSSETRRNFRLEEGKRRRIGSKGDGIGSLVNLDNKEFLVIELSGAPTRLPMRHTEGDKVKIERCLVDVLNNHLDRL
ncbi:1585_t:CDS:2 [Funneliformis mosseae]|uniref:1585_t:CDS:1 n=1 Tax=Funneliformis mosseae TaxID=27381 RepID=A0A9N9FZ22_FUNMO|nr:1585_t:CDS:2 [Funneliformis mosseae]